MLAVMSSGPTVTVTDEPEVPSVDRVLLVKGRLVTANVMPVRQQGRLVGHVATLRDRTELLELQRDWLDEALDLARRVASRPPLAAKLAKQAVLAAEETALSAGLEQERRLYEIAMATEDRVEGMRAFLEKRKPDYTGR